MNTDINTERPLRRSNIELLRIICIVLIILRHYANSTQLAWGIMGVNDWSWHLLFLQLITIGGSTANNVFLLITGYFMINRGVNWKRVVGIIAEMFFYSWIIMAVIYGFNILPFSAKEMLKGVFPIWFGYNWYICCYVILCCFTPFINKFLKVMSKTDYQKFLTVLLMIWSLANTLGAKTYFGTEFSIDHFIILYIFGAYIGRFGITPNRRTHRFYFVFFASLLLISVVAMSVCGAVFKSDILIMNALFFVNEKNLLQLAVSVSLFLWAVHAKPFYSKRVNSLAKSVAGIFLIHHNPLLLELIWYKISPDIDYINSNFLPVHCIIKVAIVFVVCLIIDQFRLATIDKVFNRWLDKNWDALKTYFGRMCFKIRERIPFD